MYHHKQFKCRMPERSLFLNKVLFEMKVYLRINTCYVTHVCIVAVHISNGCISFYNITIICFIMMVVLMYSGAASCNISYLMPLSSDQIIVTSEIYSVIFDTLTTYDSPCTAVIISWCTRPGHSVRDIPNILNTFI